jgi:hypothetical protein
VSTQTGEGEKKQQKATKQIETKHGSGRSLAIVKKNA